MIATYSQSKGMINVSAISSAVSLLMHGGMLFQPLIDTCFAVVANQVTPIAGTPVHPLSVMHQKS